MDSYEYELTIRKYKASIELLRYIEPKLKQKYTEATTGKHWNPNSFIYKLLHTDTNRRKLSLLIHPDKSDEPDSKNLFCLIETLKDEQPNPIDYKNSELITLKKELSSLENSVWYIYHTEPNLFHDAFITEQELEQYKFELKQECQRLLLENQQLIQEIKNLQNK